MTGVVYQWHPDVVDDFRELPHDLRDAYLERIESIKSDPKLGEHLDRRASTGDLSASPPSDSRSSRSRSPARMRSHRTVPWVAQGQMTLDVARPARDTEEPGTGGVMDPSWHGAFLVGMVSAGVDVDEAAQHLIEEGIDAGMLAEIEGFVRELDLDPSARDRTRLLVERTRLLVERATASAQTSDRLRAEGRTGTSDAAAGLSGLAGLLRHELATPLAIAEMALETLAARRDEPATMERMVEVARRNLRLANHLVHGLSSVEDLKTGRAELSRTQVDLAALVRECIEDVGGVLAGDHGIDVDVEQIVEAPADRDAVRQVLVNLLTNAAKFSPNGSRIKVTVSATPEYAEVGVRDQGPGLSPQDAERIFEAGQRLDPAVPGMGLGLFVARQLARAHGGDLRLQHPDAGGHAVRPAPALQPSRVAEQPREARRRRHRT